MKELDLSTAIDSLPRIILTLSLIHLSTCVLFILGYGVGFGEGLLNLFSPSDIFSVGLKDVSFVYLSTATIPAIAKIIKLRSDKPYAEDLISAISDKDERDSALLKLERIRFVGQIGVLIISALSIGGAFYSLYNGNSFGLVMLTWPIFLWIVVFQEKIKHALNIDYKLFEIVDFSIVLFVSAIAFGAAAGGRDRSMNFDLYNDSLYCQKFAIARSVSDYFIATRSDDRKFIIDSKCSIVFRID